MFAQSVANIAVAQCRSHILTHKHDLIIDLASTNLAENFIFKNLNFTFHNFVELRALEKRRLFELISSGYFSARLSTQG